MFEYKAKVERVVDGDTYDIVCDLGFNVNMSMRIRLKGIDTPETWRPKSEAEDLHGQEASAFVQEIFAENNNRITIRTYKAGASIYGRYTADVRVGEWDLATLLIAKGYEKRDEY